MATKTKKPYVIVRTQSAGVFAGTLESRVGGEATLSNARRLWYWAGAASLSQLAVKGTSRPDDCKFPSVQPKVELLQVIEVDYCTPEGQASIEAVKPWQV